MRRTQAHALKHGESLENAAGHAQQSEFASSGAKKQTTEERATKKKPLAPGEGVTRRLPKNPQNMFAAGTKAYGTPIGSGGS